MTGNWLDEQEVDQYLGLIGVSRKLPSVEFLTEIIGCTLEYVPFQNLTMLDSDRTVPAIDDIKRLMLSGIGGICTIRNPFIHQLLRKLGFDAKLVASTIMNPDCHITIIVEIEGELWWCDPGNGFPYFSIIRLGDETTKSHPFLDYRLTETDGTWSLEHKNSDGNWFTNYFFKLDFVDFDYFDSMYLRHYTDPSFGPFLTGLRFNKWTDESGVILRDSRATALKETVRLGSASEFENWVDSNSHPLRFENLLGSKRDIHKLWEVIQ